MLAFGVAYVWVAYGITLDPWSAVEAVNSRTLPIAYGSILILLSTLLLVRGMRVHVPRHNLLRLTSISASIIGFGLLLPRVGVWAALILLLVSCLMIMGEKRWYIFILAPLLASLGGWLLIEVLLGVYVEPGAFWS